MKSPNQSTVKTFLNVTIFKPLEKNPNVGLPQSKTIDITDLLKENSVESFYNINGISRCDVGEEDEYGANVVETRFVLDEVNLDKLMENVFRIIDASIVNQKQSDAIKKLVMGEFDNRKRQCWDNIHPTVL
jgi:hypothetical protein